MTDTKRKEEVARWYRAAFDRYEASLPDPSAFRDEALSRITVRKVWIALAESYPYRKLFQQVYHNLRSAAGRPAIRWRC